MTSSSSFDDHDFIKNYKENILFHSFLLSTGTLLCPCFFDRTRFFFSLFLVKRLGGGLGYCGVSYIIIVQILQRPVLISEEIRCIHSNALFLSYVSIVCLNTPFVV